MIRRPTWVFLGLFALALAALWASNYQKEKSVLIATPQPTLVMIFNNQSSPVAIRISGEDGMVVEILDKGVEGWQIVEPALGLADSSQVDELLTSLLNIHASGSLAPAPSDEAMGLTVPVYTIQLTWADQKAKVLEVGNATPIRSGYYARVDDGQPILISIDSMQVVQNILASPPAAATATPATDANPIATTQP